MKSRLINIILSPYLIALLLALTVIFFLPALFNRYKAEVLVENLIPSVSANFLGYFEDLDGDGLSEYIHFKNNFLKNGAFTLRDHNLRTIRQWDLPGKFKLRKQSFIMGDCDNNGLKEIYTYYYRNDSLFLGYCEPFNQKDSEIKSIFVDLVHVEKGVPDFDCDFNAVHDLNKDGTKEVLFSIAARFSLQPRNVYLFDPASHSIIKSPPGYSIVRIIEIKDIDGDGKEELFSATGSNGNVPQKAGYPFHDSSAWAFIFKPDLSFKFSPFEVKGTQVTVVAFPVFGDTVNYIALFVKCVSNSAEKTLEFYLFDADFNQITTYSLDSILTEKNISTNYLYFNDHVYLIGGNSPEAFMLDADLSFSKLSNDPVNFILRRNIIDIDHDGLDELMSWNTDGVTIYRDRFKDPLTLKIPLDFDHPIRSISSFQDRSGLNKVFLQYRRTNYLISYGANPMYYFKYPFYLGIYLICLLFIFLIRRLQKFQLDQKQKIADRITNLQLRTIKSQFDPHFTFNVINSISYAVHKSDKETANQYIAELSEFVRNIVSDSEKISRPLQQELKLVSNYLKIEKLRFRNRFDFTITVQDAVNQSMQIPKNLLLTFAENAVKHGIRPLKENGQIQIEAKRAGNSTQISIEDNGAGRKPAETKTGNTGKGLGIIRQILDLYFQLNKMRITYKIVDKTQNNNPAGTKVVIIIPDA